MKHEPRHRSPRATWSICMSCFGFVVATTCLSKLRDKTGANHPQMVGPGRCLALGLPWFITYESQLGPSFQTGKPIWLHRLEEKTLLKSRHLQHSRPITSNETGTLYLLYVLNFVDIQPSWKIARHLGSSSHFWSWAHKQCIAKKKTKPLLLTLFHPLQVAEKMDFEICNPPILQATARPIRGTGVPRCAPLVAQTHADLHPGAM